jgi:anthranilate/para-aminobenzoate synthase component I
MADEAKATPLYIGGITIDDLIKLHLLNCDQCRESPHRDIKRRLGERSSHCDTYWQLQLDRANYEGQVNNIVAHTEHGDEAQIVNRLD